MLFLDDVWDNITFALVKAIRTFFLSLCDVVYRLIVITYDIFDRIGTATLLTDETISSIYTKVGLILGLFMIFRLGFSFLTYVLNPDLLTDKKNGVGNIVKKVLIVIVLLGTTPFLFKEAFRLQNLLVEQNIVGKIISGKDLYSEKPGQNLAWYAFTSFYRVNTEVLDNIDGRTAQDIIDDECPELGVIEDFSNLYAGENDGDLGTITRDFKRNNSFRYTYNCLNNDVKITKASYEAREFVIDFEGNGIVCLVVGILILWIIIMYSIQLGIRLLQLAYLQLIAPIPIMMYLNPKSDEALSKWGKQCLVTFLDFFIRSGIMYFVIFIVDLLCRDDSEFLKSFDDLPTIWQIYSKIIMIIALLMFAKRVPKLLEETFPSLKPSSGLDFGLKPSKEAQQVVGTLAGAATGLGVGLANVGSSKNAVSGVFNALGGGISGAIRGGISGAKGTKLKDIAADRAKRNATNRQNREQGNTLGVRMGTRVREAFGFDSEGYAEIAKMQYQWDSGKALDSKMRDLKLFETDDAGNIKYEDGHAGEAGFEKLKKMDKLTDEELRNLGFNSEWASSFRKRSIAKDNVVKAANELNDREKEYSAILNMHNGDANHQDVIRAKELRDAASKKYDDAQTALEAADKEKAAMDKKHSGSAQKLADYKAYTGNKDSRPGSPGHAAAAGTPTTPTTPENLDDGNSENPVTPTPVLAGEVEETPQTPEAPETPEPAEEVQTPTNDENSGTVSSTDDSSEEENIPITPENSMFANMSDEEFNERQEQNEAQRDFYDAAVANQDPNSTFEQINDAFAQKALSAQGVTEEDSRLYDESVSNLEAAYKRSGWVKGTDGVWTRDGYTPKQKPNANPKVEPSPVYGGPGIGSGNNSNNNNSNDNNSNNNSNYDNGNNTKQMNGRTRRTSWIDDVDPNDYFRTLSERRDAELKNGTLSSEGAHAYERVESGMRDAFEANGWIYDERLHKWFKNGNGTEDDSPDTREWQNGDDVGE